MDAEHIRTEEVLPPSASGETRLVLRAAGAIILGSLCIIGLQGRDTGAPALTQASVVTPFANPTATMATAPRDGTQR